MKREYVIGEKLKFFRQLNGLSQKEMSTGICSQAEISKVENGKNSPTIDLLQQVAKRLKVPLSMLFQDHLRKGSNQDSLQLWTKAVDAKKIPCRSRNHRTRYSRKLTD
ncbi:helix-turn-helix domain-containing protein [Exiguobacterium acetylicum]|nr:helix-turn-helix transcriptional regulator [Exiguobacterium acetylicum]UKS54809.1 helix-turn-helix domain-containing protein [Exiguobacterium acetylicum]